MSVGFVSCSKERGRNVCEHVPGRVLDPRGDGARVFGARIVMRVIQQRMVRWQRNTAYVGQMKLS
jgi:hypothetical protein